jgi:hypothetical protein
MEPYYNGPAQPQMSNMIPTQNVTCTYKVVAGDDSNLIIADPLNLPPLGSIRISIKYRDHISDVECKLVGLKGLERIQGYQHIRSIWMARGDISVVFGRFQPWWR